MDALANPSVDVEDYVIATDIPNLSILPAGAQTNQDTEYLAASRAGAVLDQLTAHDPARIIIFDSPPALAASPASVLALQVGQTVVVVHADVTTDSALRDALSLLSGCEHIQLMLNKPNSPPPDASSQLLRIWSIIMPNRMYPLVKTTLLCGIALAVMPTQAFAQQIASDWAPMDDAELANGPGRAAVSEESTGIARERPRLEVTPYIEVQQVLFADLDGRTRYPDLYDSIGGR